MKLDKPVYTSKLKKLTIDNLAIAVSYSFEAVMALVATAVLMLLPDKSVYVDAVAGVGAMFSTSVVISAFQRGMTETALTETSRRYAKGDAAGGGWQMMVDVVSLNMVATSCLLVLVSAFAFPVLSFVCGNDRVASLILPVFMMSCWSYLIEIPGFAISINMRGTDDVKWAARFPFIRESLYVLALLVCVPMLGVLGVGVAIIVTHVLITSFKLFVVFSGRSNMRPIKDVRPDAKHALAILRQGFPLSLKVMFTRAGVVVVGGCIGAVSTVALAAVSICNDIVTVLEGLEHANKLNCQVLVAADPGHREESVAAAGTYALVAGAFCWLIALLVVCPVSAVTTNDAEIALAMVALMPAAAPYLFFDAFYNLGLGILQGLDKQASIGVVTVLTTLSVNVALPLAFVWLGVNVFWIVFLYSLNVMVRALVWGFLSARALKIAQAVGS